MTFPAKVSPGRVTGPSVAAVLGVEFPSVLWEAVVGGPIAEDDMAVLRRLALIRSADETHRTFAFRHALIQETAHAMLGDERRRLLHLRAGQALERLHDGNLVEVVDRLAYHYARSGHMEQAVEYLTRFAAQAARFNAKAESVAALEEALTCIESMSDGPEQDRVFLRFVLEQRDDVARPRGPAA